MSMWLVAMRKGRPCSAQWSLLTVAWFLASGLSGLVWADTHTTDQDLNHEAYTRQIQPLLTRYCEDCHSGEEAEAELRLEQYASLQSLRDARSTWLKVLGQLRATSMPPEDAEQPSPEERRELADWLDRALNTVDCEGPVSPGRVTLRRLNRHEYRNTIRDLLGIDYAPARDFPADDVGYGFDNIGDVLSLPPLLMEKYLAAAEEISALATVLPAGAASTPQDVEATLTRLASSAFRRPATPAEVQRLVALVQLAQQEGDTLENGLRLALQAMLVSPHFLFRVERDPDEGEEVRTLDDFELATRLSYFLWSSLPDEALFALSREGRLRDAEELERQVRRMLADPKAQAYIENFAGQWLQLRNLDDMAFDATRFPGSDRQLLADMREETTRFFAAVVRDDMSLLRILDADFTFLNERLAQHYGISGVTGPEFRQISLQGTPRTGILTHASVLAVTSNPTRTSPVKRGKFVLENLLGAPPPPPPPNVPLLEDAGRELTGTLRQRMEQHRTNPTCAACHQLMDPIGFALEHFDAIGRYREDDGGEPIDAAGVLPTGEPFAGLDELRKVLLENQRDEFVRCMVEKTLVYSLGRGLEYYDQCAVSKISTALKQDDYRVSRLVLEVVRSEPFQKRARKRSQE